MKPTHVLRAHIPEAGMDGKARYITVGTLFLREDGTPVIKLDCTPADGRWQGWINAFPWEEKEKSQKVQKPYTPPRNSRAADEDDIPF